MQDRPLERQRGDTLPPVTRLELRPFGSDFLDAAASLLARRHAEQRAVEPSLPAEYEQLEVARTAITERATDEASGAVATRGGAAVGYLLGTPRSDPMWGAERLGRARRPRSV